MIASLKAFIPALLGAVKHAAIERLTGGAVGPVNQYITARNVNGLGYDELGMFFDWTNKSSEFGEKVGKKERRFQGGFRLRHDMADRQSLEKACNAIAIPLCKYGIIFEI